MSLWKDLKSKVKHNYPLKDKTTFKIGPKVKDYCEPEDINDLRLLLRGAGENNLPVFILGAGSNILIIDNPLKALVIKLNNPYFKKISVSKNRMEIGSGVNLSRAIAYARDSGLGGLEFLSGIPGTAGGALCMNAGAWGREIKELVENIKVMDYNGRVKTLSKRNARFTYRNSGLKKYIVLSASFQLHKKNKNAIGAAIRKYLLLRKDKQDFSCPNAGCIFKNPKNNSAGRIIEMSGLKGLTCGGARVSLKHANFILNYNNAKANDVLKLMDLIQKKVKQNFGIALNPEIKIWAVKQKIK